MRVVILGSAAGGGLPQWNCRCPICTLARSEPDRVRPRTQSSIAVSADGSDWLLINASPDIRQQLFDNPQMHPREGKAIVNKAIAAASARMAARKARETARRKGLLEGGAVL